jgi:hypothetical protein
MTRPSTIIGLDPRPTSGDFQVMLRGLPSWRRLLSHHRLSHHHPLRHAGRPADRHANIGDAAIISTAKMQPIGPGKYRSNQRDGKVLRSRQSWEIW